MSPALINIDASVNIGTTANFEASIIRRSSLFFFSQR